MDFGARIVLRDENRINAKSAHFLLLLIIQVPCLLVLPFRHMLEVVLSMKRMFGWTSGQDERKSLHPALDLICQSLHILIGLILL